MLLWIGFGILTAAVIAALLHPLQRDAAATEASADPDLAVYRDQLSELDAEQERGTLTPREVESARAEVARRLIKRSDAIAKPGAGSRAPYAPTVFYAVAALVPAATVATYLALGSPALPDLPHSTRLSGSATEGSVIDMIGRVEARLRNHPEDGEGWDVIAPVYLKLGRFADAARAYQNAARLLGESEKRVLGFGEARLLGENGVVTEEVRRAAERLLVLAPARPEGRVWLALGREQDGDFKGAADLYRQVLASAPANADWRQPISERLASVEGKARGGAADGSSGGAANGSSGGAAAQSSAETAPQLKGPRRPVAEQQPPADAVARMEALSPSERAAAIDQMVAGLAERLKRDGKDLAGWLRLVRAYKVLGKEGEAANALAAARSNFGGDATSLAALDELAKSLGLGS